MQQRIRRQPDHPASRPQSGAQRGSPQAPPQAATHATVMRREDVQALQRQAGNRIARQVASGAVQRLNVTAAGDQQEQEADRVARQVVQQLRAAPTPAEAHDASDAPVARALDDQAPVQRIDMLDEEEELQLQRDHVQRLDMLDEEELQLQRDDAGHTEVGAAGGTVSNETAGAIGSASGGRPLSGPIRGQMEQAFSADFSSVRVHQGQEAAALNDRLSARAFTTGSDIFLGRSAAQPSSEAGRELLAHELTHVIQQGAAPTAGRRHSR